MNVIDSDKLEHDVARKRFTLFGIMLCQAVGGNHSQDESLAKTRVTAFDDTSGPGMEIDMAEQKPTFEIPADMRRMAEQSVEQAKKAFDGFMTAAHKAASSWEQQTSTAQEGAKNLGQKAVSYAEKNIMSSFEFAEKVLRAKDVQEVMRLQAEYVSAQMQTMSEQAREIGAAGTKATMDAARPKTSS